MTSRSPRSGRSGRPARGAARKNAKARRESPQRSQARGKATKATKKIAQRTPSRKPPTPRKKPVKQVVVRSDNSETLERTIARTVKPGSDKRRPSWRQGSAAAARRVSQRPGKASRRVGAGLSDSAVRRRPGKSAPKAVEAAPEQTTERRSIVWHGKERTRSVPLQWAAFALVLLLAGIIVLNPVSQYVAQQQEKRVALASLEETKTRIDALEKSLAKWQDDAFVKSQARERLGYVMPGETLYMVSDPERGTAKEQLDKRTAEVNRKMREVTPFYLTIWDSVTIAGEAKGAGEEVENPSQVPVLNDSGKDSTTEKQQSSD